jgi:hypothetical protein
MAARSDGPTPSEKPAADQPSEARPQELVVRLDERNLRTTYANAFRTNATAEEVMLDFGLNMLGAPSKPGGQPDIIFQITERIVMNYFQAKRLALTLGKIIRDHEEAFGELELDVAKRRKGGA